MNTDLVRLVALRDDAEKRPDVACYLLELPTGAECAEAEWTSVGIAMFEVVDNECDRAVFFCGSELIRELNIDRRNVLLVRGTLIDLLNSATACLSLDMGVVCRDGASVTACMIDPPIRLDLQYNARHQLFAEIRQ